MSIEKTNGREYVAPAILETATLLMDALMVPTSRLIQSTVNIDGQEIGGYFESSDLSSDWE